MPNVEDSFEELRSKLKSQERLLERSSEPIYYLVFGQREMQLVKRRFPIWKEKLEQQDGWRVHQLSLGRRIQEFLRTHKRLQTWLEYERTNPGDYEAVRKTLVSQLADTGLVTTWVVETLTAAAADTHGIAVLTDVEAIHPFLRIGAVEQSLQGRCPAPLVILYPGVRSGNTILRFLGEYPEDGNYRSLMIGGE